MQRFATVCLAAAAGLYLAFAWSIIVMAAADTTTNDSAWLNPAFKSMKRVSPLGNAQRSPDFLNNLDCTLLTYRAVSSTIMQSGCFTSTAFGFFDSSNSTVIFNGTDEGLSLHAYAPGQILVPWPKALSLVSLSNVSTGGTYISLYKNPLVNLRNIYSFSGQLVGKQLTEPADMQVKDANGNRLIINPQSLAFSSDGSWLVAETLSGSFVRVNLASLDTQAFAQAFGAQGSPALLKSQVTVSDSGRFVAIENNTAQSFKVHDLATCTTSNSDWRANGCKSYEYWPFVQQQIPQTSMVRQVRFIHEGLITFEAVTPHQSTSGTYVMAPTGQITALINYLGLGDSYTSGEGAFNYRAGTDTKENSCHLSVHSYPLLLTRDLFSNSGGNSIACSGALISDVTTGNTSYRGQVRKFSLQEFRSAQTRFYDSVMTNYLPGYVAQQEFVKRYQPGIITVSVGGNDIGFGDMLERCVMAKLSRHLSDNVCYNTYEDRLEVIKLIDRTVPRWTALYRQLQANAPESHVFAIGYPDIVSDTGRCAINVQLNKSELSFSKELVRYLNGAIRQAATNAGASYVDITEALAGHRLCETASYNVAVNGLTAGKDAGFFGIRVMGSESYHPNALGHQLIEQAILKQTNNFRIARSVPSNIPNSSTVLLNAPKSGRATQSVVPGKIIKAVIEKGVSSPLRFEGVAVGLYPNAQYSIRLDGPTGSVLQTVLSDKAGNVSADINLPGSVASGGHTINIVGAGQSGQTVNVNQNIYVPVSGIDADGDTIADQADSCPYVTNSAQDEDRDGIDDVCDGIIGSAPVSPGGQVIAGAATGSTVTPQADDTTSGSRMLNSSPLGVTPTASVVSPPASTSRLQPAVSTQKMNPLQKLPNRKSSLENGPSKYATSKPLIYFSPYWRTLFGLCVVLLLILFGRRSRRPVPV